MKNKISSLDSPKSVFAELWSLDPDIAFLNHGSFGACPRIVLEKQQALREQLEREPVYFLVHELENLLDNTRNELATFVGASPDDLVFVPNATTGVNTVLRSLLATEGSCSLQPGDELLTTNHEYNASRNALNFAAQQAKACVVVAEIPFPLESTDQVIEAVLRLVSPRTKLALLDHVTSHTGLVFPIQRLVYELSSRGVDTLIDGAHAPGMLPLNLRELGATYYTGNCHKWLCAPKGAAFLYVQADKQAGVRPLVISHGANSPRCDRSRFQLEFGWTGTGDPTSYLCVSEAIQFIGSLLPRGWTEIMERNQALALSARQTLCQALDVPLPCPEEMIGSLATIPLDDRFSEDLQAILFNRFCIEVPVVPWSTPPNRLIRISAQLYNTASQYAYLADTLVKLQDAT